MNQSKNQSNQDQETHLFEVQPVQLPAGKRIAFVQACWHKDIVDQCRDAFIETMSEFGVSRDQIDVIEVPGSLEIPLQSKLLAKTGRYASIVTSGLVVDGGIYRHDFVASTVLDAIMQVQLETEVPVLSAILTPHHFQETEAHETFFYNHFKIKGREAAHACAQMIANLTKLEVAA